MRHLLSRRKLLMAGAGAVALSGCAELQNVVGSTTASQTAVTALQAVAAEITQILPQLVSAGLGGNTLTSVSQIVGEIQQALSGVSTAMTQSQGQSILTTVETYINDLAPLILPFLSAIPGGSIIGMIVAALPAIEALVGVAVSALSSVAASVATTAPPLATSAVFGAPTPALQYLNLLEQRAAKTSARYHRR